MANKSNIVSVSPTMGFVNWLLIVVLSFCWGGSFAFNEVLLEELSPISIVWSRQFVASLLYIIIALPYLHRVNWSYNLLWRLCVLGLFAIAVPFTLFAYGQQNITSVLAGIGNGTVPLFTMLIATMILPDERMTKFTFLGLLIGFVGIVLLFLPMLSIGDFASSVGLAATVVASMMYGFCNVFARSIPKSPVQVQALIINLCAVLVLTPFMFLDAPNFTDLSTRAYSFLFIQGLFCSFFAYLLYLKMIKRVGSVNTSQVAYIIPFAALILGVLWLGEDVSMHALFALALVILGLWVKDRSQKSVLKQ